MRTSIKQQFLKLFVYLLTVFFEGVESLVLERTIAGLVGKAATMSNKLLNKKRALFI